jgi:phosphatidylinositol alpha-1,6-mannosyltransferase
MTRSLLLTASFPPALGGIETLLYQTNRRLRDSPLVMAPAPAWAKDLDVRPVGIGAPARVAYRPLWRLHPSLHFFQRFWRPAVMAARDWHPRVIQAGHIYVAPLARMLARRLGIPYVVYAYGQEVWRFGRPMGVRQLDARLRGAALRSADRVLVPGRFTAGLLNDWEVATECITHIPYGAQPQPPAPPPTGRTLLSVARLVPRKGIDTVIRALRRLPDDVTYRVVGTGSDFGRLRQLAVAEAVARHVTFLGRLDDAALADEYRRCTLLVLPVRRTPDGDLEGYGLVYFEAAAWGRPVIAGCSGGEVDAVEHGRTGLLVDGTSVDSVAEAINSLLADQPKLQELGAAGRRRVESTHNWACAAAALDATLEALR